MNVLVNGESTKLDSRMNIKQLLQQFVSGEEKVAIELNKQVIRKKDWEDIYLSEADSVEIVHFVGGG